MRRDKPEPMNAKFATKHRRTSDAGARHAPTSVPAPPTRFDGLVVMARVPHPISIPNSAVKPLSADGTAS